MFSKGYKKQCLENRLEKLIARPVSPGKSNIKIINKIKRELKKFN